MSSPEELDFDEDTRAKREGFSALPIGIRKKQEREEERFGGRDSRLLVTLCLDYKRQDRETLSKAV